jgi:lipopolysaccharide assembly outer membrane protein LptD (OstA)
MKQKVLMASFVTLALAALGIGQESRPIQHRPAKLEANSIVRSGPITHLTGAVTIVTDAVVINADEADFNTDTDEIRASGAVVVKLKEPL